MPPTNPNHEPSFLRVSIGLAAVAFPLLYLGSDVVEVTQGGFTTVGLAMTYAAEAGITLLVIGLCALLHDRLPGWALVGGLLYSYAYLFFTSTVVWALVANTTDWETLSDDFGAWLTVHGAVMVLGGLALGAGIVRSGVLPRWTGWALAVGVVLVAAASGLGDLERTLASAVPDAALVGIGLALLRDTTSYTAVGTAVGTAASPPTLRSTR